MLALLQLADSCFPAGGFAFSNGLEGLAKSGWLRGIRDFQEYLESYLSQVAHADLPFLNSAFPLLAPAAPEARPDASVAGRDPGSAAGADPASSAPGDNPGPDQGFSAFSAFSEIALEWDAFLTLPAPRKASLAQGQAWLRAMEGAHSADPRLGPALAALRPRFRETEVPAHFLMALAATLRIAGFALPEAQSLLLHMALRDQLGAAVRLGLIGSLQAQGLHTRAVPLAEALRRKQAAATHHRARKTAPMIEMGQAGHPYLYSKLFQS
jgi:urease accessory protein